MVFCKQRILRVVHPSRTRKRDCITSMLYVSMNAHKSLRNSLLWDAAAATSYLSSTLLSTRGLALLLEPGKKINPTLIPTEAGKS